MAITNGAVVPEFDVAGWDEERSVQELKHRIRLEVNQIPVEMLRRVMGESRSRLTECIRRNGGHLKDVIFKK